MNPPTEGLLPRLRKLYGQLHWTLRHWSDPASPLRFLHGRVRKALRPRELIRRRRAGRRLARELDPVIARAVQTFEEDGLVSVDHLIDRALLEELAAYYEDIVVPRRQDLSAQAARPFFSPLRTEADIGTAGIAVRFALQEKILRLLSAYMGKLPFIRNLSFLESNPVPGQTKWEQSQLWHLDSNYTLRTPALWVYLTEVDSIAQGPFTYLPASASRRLKNSFVPRHFADEEVAAAGLAGEIRQVIAPRLSCFLVDNSRIYHLGSRMGEGARRAVYIAHYVDPTIEKPWIRLEKPVPEEHHLLLYRE